MDSYVTYLQITSAESSKVSLLQLPPSPHVSPFSLYGCCLLQMQEWGDLGEGPRLLYWGWEPAASLPGGRPPVALLPGGKVLHAIKQKF